MTDRNQPGVVLTMPTPAIADGKPVVPRYWGHLSATCTAVIGPTAIHAEPPPQPLPSHNGYYYPPAPVAGTFTARWSVEYLPDPSAYLAGYYWLGDPSSQDGTSSIQSGARLWRPDGGSSSAPSWHSFFPYKPSVTSATHFLFGGRQVHHPKGVNFNSHFIEHMWMNFPTDRRQPFTWLIAAMVTSWPTTNYAHHLLDSGRNPDSVHFPRLTDDQTGVNRKINDGLGYRNTLTISQNHMGMATGVNPTQVLRCNIDGALRPKMFIGIFDGAHSYVGAYSPGRKLLTKGRVDTGSGFAHKYYVLGRRYGIVGPSFASNLLVFEMRYWSKALNTKQLAEQYDALSSRHQFNAYNGM